MLKRYLITFVLVISIAQTLFSNNISNLTFESISISHGLPVPFVYCFQQDSIGNMWIGTDNGLCKYNGYKIKVYKEDSNDERALSNSRINSFLIDSNNNFYIGTDRGVNIYNRKSDDFEKLDFTVNYSVKFLIELPENRLLIGTNDGVFVYDAKSKEFLHYNNQKEGDLFLPVSYALAGYYSRKGDVYVGGDNFLSIKRKNSTKFIQIFLSADTHKSNNLVLAVLEEQDNPEQILIGTENSLKRYNTITKMAEVLLTGFPIKALNYDKYGNLWVGTDKGLYIKYSSKDEFVLYNQQINNTQSLSNDVVWSIYFDRNNLAWLGTDNGISTTKIDNSYQYVSIGSITNSSKSNRLLTICKDDSNTMFLGGSNGLIVSNKEACILDWYTAENNNLKHNKIRDFFDDGNILWIGTDGGLHYYDKTRKEIKFFILKDSTNSFFASWIYSIKEDNQGNLWLGTYESGLFIVNKQKLLNSNSNVVTADKHLLKQNGFLLSNIVSSIGINGNIAYVGSSSSGLTIINTDDYSTIFVTKGNSILKSNIIKQVSVDKWGTVWFATGDGIFNIEHGKKSLRHVLADKISGPVLFTLSTQNNLWYSVGSDIFCLDKNSSTVSQIKVNNEYYFNGTCDLDEKTVLFVSSDGYTQLDYDSDSEVETQKRVVITDLLLANQSVELNKKYAGNTILTRPIEETESIVLEYNQNSFSLDLTSFSFLLEPNLKYQYRLVGFDDEWHLTDGRSNRLSFINIPYERYVLEVKLQDSDIVTRLKIRVKPPWYLSYWAMLIYIVLLAYLLFQILSIITYKQKLSIERMDRERTMKLTKEKMDFFANLFHDFKTPLSLIINQSTAIIKEKSAPDKKSILSIQNNAQKIHQIIVEMLTDIDSDPSQISLIFTEASIKKVISSQFKQFEEAFRMASQTAVLELEAEDVVMLIDQARIKSVILNLISNAIKFTPKNGKIIVRSYIRNGLTNREYVVEVIDNGVGISDEDKLNIFNRFYKSQNSANINVYGSGIGLSIVKSVVEQHHGEVFVESELDKGTKIGFVLPIVVLDKEAPESEKNSKKRVLIVDDSPELLQQLVESFSHRYEVVTAENGKIAYEKAITTHPDLIITDCAMPIMTGLNLVSKLKENIKTFNIPIIIMTGLDDKNTEFEAYRAKVDAFINKPFEMNYLLFRAKHLIEGYESFLMKQTVKEYINTENHQPVELLNDDFLESVTSIIEDNMFDEGLSPKTISDKLNLAEKSLYRKLKQYTGMPTVEYIRTVRLRKSSMLLKSSSLSISEILYQVGFSNASYFTKTFKKEFGMTPKEFRDKFCKK